MSLAFNKFNSFVQDAGDGVFDLNTDTLALALFVAATSPTSGDSRYNSSSGFQLNSSGATEVAAGNGYTAGGIDIPTTSYSQSGGLATLFAGTGLMTWTASGAGFSLRYIVAYDVTAGVATARPLLGWWDYGSTLSLSAGQTFSLSFPNDVLTVQ